MGSSYLLVFILMSFDKRSASIVFSSLLMDFEFYEKTLQVTIAFGGLTLVYEGWCSTRSSFFYNLDFVSHNIKKDKSEILKISLPPHLIVRLSHSSDFLQF